MSNSPESSRRPIQEYVYQIPGPPSVWIPSPVLNNNEELSIEPSASHDYGSTGFANVDFLEEVTYPKVETSIASAILDWNHQQRWTAQLILPFLYLGPSSMARDDVFLREQGITMILRIRTLLTSGYKILAAMAPDQDIEIHDINVRGAQDLIAAFPQGIELINAHMSAYRGQSQELSASLPSSATSLLGKVLVCCETGNECAPCMVAAYLMAMYTINFVKAIQIIQAQRFSAIFGDEARNMLQTYYTILQAKQTVIQSRTGNVNQTLPQNEDRGQLLATTPPKANKRSLDEVYDDGMNPSVAYDSELAHAIDGRDGQAPFQDGEYA